MSLQNFLRDGNLVNFLTKKNPTEFKALSLAAESTKTQTFGEIVYLNGDEFWSFLQSIDYLQISKDILGYLVEFLYIPVKSVLKSVRYLLPKLSIKSLKHDIVLLLPFVVYYILMKRREVVLVHQDQESGGPNPVDILGQISETSLKMESFDTSIYENFITKIVKDENYLLALTNVALKLKASTITESSTITDLSEHTESLGGPTKFEIEMTKKTLESVKILFDQFLEEKTPKLKKNYEDGQRLALNKIDGYLERYPEIQDLFKTLMSIPLEGILLVMQEKTNYDVFQFSNVVKMDPEVWNNYSQTIGNSELLLLEQNQITEYNQIQALYVNGTTTKVQHIASLWNNAIKYAKSLNVTSENVEYACKAVFLRQSFLQNNVNIYPQFQEICTKLVDHRIMHLNQLDKLLQESTLIIPSSTEITMPIEYNRLDNNTFREFYGKTKALGVEDAELMSFFPNVTKENPTFDTTKLKELLKHLQANNDDTSWISNWWNGADKEKKYTALKLNDKLNDAYENFKKTYAFSSGGKKFPEDVVYLNDSEMNEFNDFLLKNYETVPWWLFGDGKIKHGKDVKKIYRYHSFVNSMLISEIMISDMRVLYDEFRNDILTEEILIFLRTAHEEGSVIKTAVFEPDPFQKTVQNYLTGFALLNPSDGLLTKGYIASNRVLRYFDNPDIARSTAITSKRTEIFIKGDPFQFVLKDPFTQATLLNIGFETVSNGWNWIKENDKIWAPVVGLFCKSATGGVPAVGALLLTIMKNKAPIENLPAKGKFFVKHSIVSFLEYYIFNLLATLVFRGNSPSLINPEAFVSNNILTNAYALLLEENSGVYPFPKMTYFLVWIMYRRMRKVSLIFWSRLLGGQIDLLPRRGLTNVSMMQDITYSLFYVMWHRSPHTRSEFYPGASDNVSIEKRTFLCILNFNIMNMCPIECRDNLFYENTWIDTHGDWTNDVVTAIFTSYNPLKISFFLTMAGYVINCLTNGLNRCYIPIYNPCHHLFPKGFSKESINYNTLLKETDFPYKKFVNLKKLDEPTLGNLNDCLDNRDKKPYIAIEFPSYVYSKKNKLKIFEKYNGFELCFIVFRDEQKSFSKFDGKWFSTEEKTVQPCRNIQKIYNDFDCALELLLFQKTNSPEFKKFDKKWSEEMNYLPKNYKPIPWIFKKHKQNHTSCLFEALAAIYIHMFINSKEDVVMLNEMLVSECKRIFSSLGKHYNLTDAERKVVDSTIEDVDISIALSTRKEIVDIFLLGFKEFVKEKNAQFKRPLFFESNQNGVEIGDPASIVIKVVPQMFDVYPIGVFPHYIPLVLNNYTEEKKTNSFTKDPSFAQVEDQTFFFV